MPRQIITAPGHDRNRSLGWLIVAWIEFFVVHGPGDVQGEPVHHGDEATAFIADCYALDENGDRLYDATFYSRSKGCDKSGLAARLSIAEAIGPVRFDGWAEGGEIFRDGKFRYVYEKGEPMGKRVLSPYIRCMATEEQQVGNTYDSIYFNFKDPNAPLSSYPGVDAGLSRIIFAGGGTINPSTAAGSSKDGGKETFAVFDESHLMNTPELKRMYKFVTRNMVKRRNTWFLETTTMFQQGQDSVAEDTMRKAGDILEGKAKRARQLFDHRWGECEDLSDEVALRAAIIEAYGDAVEWMNVDSVMNQIMDQNNDVSDSRRYFLNAPTSASDAWISLPEWTACTDKGKSLRDGDRITIGFDGSIHEDATAVVACRLSDRYVEILGLWEKPVTPVTEGIRAWEVDVAAVDAVIADSFGRYDVIAFFADPAQWRDSVSRWTAEFGDRLKLKASRGHPVEWQTNRSNYVVQALERVYLAVRTQTLSHNGDTRLTRHVLNARRRRSRDGIQIAKEYPKSPNKIDAAYAMTLAVEAAGMATAAGIGMKKTPQTIMKIY